MNEKTMMLIQATWQDAQTFKLLPVSSNSPYVECIFDPETKVFVVISKIRKTSLHMLPKLDEYGQSVTGTKGMKQERHKIEVFQEFYVEDLKAIDSLIQMHASNVDEFDYKKFFTATTLAEKKKETK